MPALSVVLSQVGSQHRSAGGQIAPVVTERLTAVIQLLEALAVEVTSDAGSVALLGALLTHDQAVEAAKTLGLPHDLLQPPLATPNAGRDYQLGTRLQIGTPDDAVVAAAELVAMGSGSNTAAGAAARVGVIEGLKPLLQAPHGAVATAAHDVLVHLPPIALATPLDDPVVVSISIDLVGSTEGKTRMAELFSWDRDRIEAFNKELIREFTGVELRFYKAATERGLLGTPIHPQRFFAVKAMGDEVWVLCTLSRRELATHGLRVIYAALMAAAERIVLARTERGQDPGFDPNFDVGRTATIQSPVKIFVDLFQTATSIEEIRQGVMTTAAAQLLLHHTGQPAVPAEVSDVARRLGLGGYEPIGNLVAGVRRTDYVGHEVDRFFRTTKSALPGIVTIGESLFRALDLRLRSWKGGIYAVEMSGAPVMHQTWPVHAVPQVLHAKELKGIGREYSTYHLFAPRALSRNYEADLALRGQSDSPGPYGLTRGEIAPERLRELTDELDRRDAEAAAVPSPGGGP